MAKKLYVGNLSYSATDASLKDAFAPMGAIESAMTNDDEALKAIESMNGAEVEGRKLTVNEAKPLSERPPRRNFDNRGGGSRY